MTADSGLTTSTPKNGWSFNDSFYPNLLGDWDRPGSLQQVAATLKRIGTG